MYSGSTCKQGELEAVVIATGVHSFFGKAAHLVDSTHQVGHFQKVRRTLLAATVTYVNLTHWSWMHSDFFASGSSVLLNYHFQPVDFKKRWSQEIFEYQLVWCRCCSWCCIQVLTSIGNFCIVSIALGLIIEIVVMYAIQKRKYREGIDNLLVLLIGGIPIAMPTVLSVTMAIGSHRLSQQVFRPTPSLEDLISSIRRQSVETFLLCLHSMAASWTT